VYPTQRINALSQGSSPNSGGAANQREIIGLVGTAAVLVLRLKGPEGQKVRWPEVC
jgi:hypothetical protein